MSFMKRLENKISKLLVPFRTNLNITNIHWKLAIHWFSQAISIQTNITSCVTSNYTQVQSRVHHMRRRIAQAPGNSELALAQIWTQSAVCGYYA